MADKHNRIFIVDDDQATRETLTEVLSLKGYTAESAGSAEKAIEKVKDWPVDLFLIDLRMPGMGGIELLKKLDIMNNTYEAIMITAYAGMDSAKEAMEYGAINYISKPIMYKELAPLMKKALETVKLKKLRVDHVKELEEKVEARTMELEKENKKLKLVEKILSESEERYRNLSEQSPVGIGVATFDGKVVYMNWKMAEITGYSSKELEKISLFSIYENVKDRKKLIDQLNRDGMVNDFHVRLKRKDGTLYDAQLSVSKVRIGGQDLLQTICVDITERKKIEEALREGEEKYSTLVEQSKDAVIIIQDGACVFTNNAVTDITGYTMKDLSGDNFWDFIAPESRERVVNTYKNRMAGKKAPTNYEMVLKHKDGSDRHAEISAGLIQYKGKPAVMGTLRDITERKRAERELQQSNKRYQELFEGINDAVIVYSSDGKFVDCNKATLLRLGYSYEEFLNLTPSRIVDPDYHSLMRKNQKKIWSGKSTVVESAHISKDGRIIPVEVNAHKTEYAGEPSILAVVRDITERKKTEEAIKGLAKFPSENPNPVLRIDNKGNILFKNEAAKYLLKEAGLREKDIHKILPANGRTLIAKSLKARKPLYDLEVIIGDKICSYTMAPVAENLYVNLYATDITERKEAENALNQKIIQMDSFINNIPDMAWLKDNNSNFIAANKAFGDAVGMGPEYLINHTCEVCFGKEAAKKFKEDDNKVIQSKKQVIFEESIIDAKKNKVWLETVKSPIIDKSGKVIGTVGIARNITDRKKAVEALQESERKLSEQNVMLQEKNIALREVMDQLEGERDRLGKQMNINVDRLLLPLTTKLRGKGSNLDKTYIDLLEENLKELASQFGGKLSDIMLRLTQKEIEMCNMIKQGLTSKEIAKLLDISHRTVETHRNNIRKKLGIGKQEVNLVTYLKSIA